MARFVVRERLRPVSGVAQFLVVDTEDEQRPVAEFDDRETADAHAARLEEGPFDWDDQDAWQDEWDDDADGRGPAGTG